MNLIQSIFQTILTLHEQKVPPYYFYIIIRYQDIIIIRYHRRQRVQSFCFSEYSMWQECGYLENDLHLLMVALHWIFPGTGPTGALACMQPARVAPCWPRVAPWCPMMAHFCMLLQSVIGRELPGEGHVLGAETNSKRHHNCTALSTAGANSSSLKKI